MARHVLERPELELVGGVDIDPAKAGKDIGEVIGLRRPLGPFVSESLAQALSGQEADLVLHTTSSYFRSFKPQILEVLRAGLDVISTSEELSFPWLAHPEEAAEIDAVARKVGKTALGTGVNPGFLMDALPLQLTAICQQVDRVEVSRTIDASTRRGPFQTKIGCGMAHEAFEAHIAAGKMGHVGLSESMGMLFHTLGRRWTRIEAEVEPVIAKQALQTEFVQVQRGQVRGLRQVARGYGDGEEPFVTLTFVAALGAAEEGDVLRIYGRPDLEVRLWGTNGDIATVAIAVNAIPRVRAAPPGLVTMADLPLVAFWQTLRPF